MTDYKALCAELTDAVLSDDSHIDCAEIARRARAALAAEQVSPDAGEVAELVTWLWSMHELAGEHNPEEQCRYERAADLLEHLALQPELEGPSDAELVQLAFREKLGRLDSNGNIITRYYYPMDIGENVIDFARAVLARWGQ